MDENLLGYLLGALDPDESRKVEALLEADPAARERLEALRQLLDPLAADSEDEDPPRGLTARTLARVAAGPCSDLPRAPACDAPAGPALPFWRRADALVAACVLLAVGGVLAHWLFSLRRPDSAASTLACQNNLRELYVPIKQFSERHDGNFPDKAAVQVGPVSFCCPANGGASCYAYSQGYRTSGGVVVLRYEADKPVHRMPLMADSPPADPLHGNSPDHGGKGQNVLFMDGHVEFCKYRTVGVGGDDIFVNKASQVAAGLDWADAVLGRGSACPGP
jgi:prepilin-type processing-associated H-X9-DG protein